MGATFDNYDVTHESQGEIKHFCERYTASFKDRLAKGDSILMLGNFGTGKNHLAAAITKGVTDQGYLALHTTAMNLVGDIKDTWNRGSERTEKQALASFIKPDLLIIDEVGIQFGSVAEKILMMGVVNGRYSEQKPTIMISMLGEAKLSAMIGEHIIDRFKDGAGAILYFDWTSHRGTKKGGKG
jgi:DNA replication protein DnaC